MSRNKMPNYKFAVKSEKTGAILKSGLNSVGEAWDWLRLNTSEGYVALVEESETINKED